jgi:hypothetical protein
MRFFIPHAKDTEEENKVYESIKKFAKENTAWNIGDRRIFSIDYNHDGKRYYAEVGKVENLIGEEVIAILESGYSNTIVYLVCTPNRGVVRGMPILVGSESVYSMVDFDEK